MSKTTRIPRAFREVDPALIEQFNTDQSAAHQRGANRGCTGNEPNTELPYQFVLDDPEHRVQLISDDTLLGGWDD